MLNGFQLWDREEWHLHRQLVQFVENTKALSFPPFFEVALRPATGGCLSLLGVVLSSGFRFSGLAWHCTTSAEERQKQQACMHASAPACPPARPARPPARTPTRTHAHTRTHTHTHARTHAPTHTHTHTHPQTLLDCCLGHYVLWGLFAVIREVLVFRYFSTLGDRYIGGRSAPGC